VDLGGYSKKDIEDLTGCIPLLLDECVVDGKVNLDPLKRVGIKAARFTTKIREKTKDVDNSYDWELYCQYVKACITHSDVPEELIERPELIDHRFFFHNEDDIGRYTCGAVRKAVANALLKMGNFSATAAS